MVTVTLCILSGAAFVADQATRDLAADALEAVRNSNVTIDYIAQVIRAPRQKLSDQLHGKAPFTLFCRFANRELIQHSDFWPEFLDLRARRFQRSLVSSELGVLLTGVERLVAYLAPPAPPSPRPRQGCTTSPIQLPLRPTAARREAPEVPSLSRKALAL
jgi:hypothetical protein